MKKLRKLWKILVGAASDIKAVDNLKKAIEANTDKKPLDAACAVKPEVFALLAEIENDFPQGSKGRDIMGAVVKIVKESYKLC